MPDSYRPARPYPGKRYRLKEAAENHQLIVVRCVGCRRSIRYLASDLCLILNPESGAHAVPFACSTCGTAGKMRVKLHSPSPRDYGHLIVRRTGAVRRIQTWRTVKLGD